MAASPAQLQFYLMTLIAETAPGKEFDWMMDQLSLILKNKSAAIEISTI